MRQALVQPHVLVESTANEDASVERNHVLHLVDQHRGQRRQRPGTTHRGAAGGRGLGRIGVEHLPTVAAGHARQEVRTVEIPDDPPVRAVRCQVIDSIGDQDADTLIEVDVGFPSEGDGINRKKEIVEAPAEFIEVELGELIGSDGKIVVEVDHTVAANDPNRCANP